MEELAIGIGGTLLGTILGFLLPEFTKARAAKREREQIRNALTIEIDLNIALANALGSEMGKTLGKIKPADKLRLYQETMPPWIRGVWQQQSLLLYSALTPDELKAVNVFYQRLLSLTAVPNNPLLDDPRGPAFLIQMMNDLADNIIKEGNPLKATTAAPLYAGTAVRR